LGVIIDVVIIGVVIDVVVDTYTEPWFGDAAAVNAIYIIRCGFEDWNQFFLLVVDASWGTGLGILSKFGVPDAHFGHLKFRFGTGKCAPRLTLLRFLVESTVKITHRSLRE